MMLDEHGQAGCRFFSPAIPRQAVGWKFSIPNKMPPFTRQLSLPFFPSIFQNVLFHRHSKRRPTISPDCGFRGPDGKMLEMPGYIEDENARIAPALFLGFERQIA